MQLLSILLLALIYVPILVSMSFMPYLTRKTISFGITVSEENYNSNQLRQMRKQYASISLVIYFALLIICISLIYSMKGMNDESQSTIIAISLCGMIIASIIMNLIFHFKMKKLSISLPSNSAKKSVLAIDTSFRQKNLILSNKWFIIHGVVIVIGAILVLMNYDKIPNNIPMKFDFQGNVTSSADKSYRTVFFPTITQIVMMLLFIFVNWSIQKSKQQIDAAHPERSITQNTLFRRRWSMFTILTSLAVIVLFSFIQLNMIHPLNPDVMIFVSMSIPAFIILFAVILSFTTGQGGSRIGEASSSNAQPFKDDMYWKLGSIYYNPQDPSIFVEKRVGIGWTVNFGHPAGSLFLLGIIALIVAVSFITGVN
ncbi:hypothetical protein D3C78_1042030 [compost metagenome]